MLLIRTKSFIFRLLCVIVLIRPFITRRHTLVIFRVVLHTNQQPESFRDRCNTAVRVTDTFA